MDNPGEMRSRSAMCARFTQMTRDLNQRQRWPMLYEIEGKELRPNYNVAPTQQVLVNRISPKREKREAQQAAE